MKYGEFTKHLQDHNVIAVLRAPSKDLALKAIRACFDSGLSTIEVTFSTPDTAAVIREAKAWGGTIGAGTILSQEQAQAAADAGAEFFISPHLDPTLTSWFVSQKLCYIPGAATPSELMQAKRLGCEVQKLFPASLYGSRGVSTILAPLPELKLIVTGGVEVNNKADFLKAGAFAVCAGASLFSADLWKSQDWKALAVRASEWVKA